jgi:hypothetical protein
MKTFFIIMLMIVTGVISYYFNDIKNFLYECTPVTQQMDQQIEVEGCE